MTVKEIRIDSRQFRFEDGRWFEYFEFKDGPDRCEATEQTAAILDLFADRRPNEDAGA